MVTVKEKPLKEKPTDSFWPPVLRVFYMLGGILAGALVGILAGAVVGGLAGLITWLLADKSTAIAVAVSLGGILAMILSVVTGVWAGSITAIGKEARQHSPLSGGSSTVCFSWQPSPLQRFAWLLCTPSISRVEPTTRCLAS
jgi:hypothetical protein